VRTSRSGRRIWHLGRHRKVEICWDMGCEGLRAEDFCLGA
jgi:hypothetical protein